MLFSPKYSLRNSAEKSYLRRRRLLHDSVPVTRIKKQCRERPYYTLDIVTEMRIDKSEVSIVHFFRQPVANFSQLYYEELCSTQRSLSKRNLEKMPTNGCVVSCIKLTSSSFDFLSYRSIQAPPASQTRARAEIPSAFMNYSLDHIPRIGHRVEVSFKDKVHHTGSNHSRIEFFWRRFYSESPRYVVLFFGKIK